MSKPNTMLKSWDEFWFSPESLVPIAVFRILFGLLVLQFAWLMSGHLHWLLGQRAIVSQETNDVFNQTARINALSWLVHSDRGLDVFWIVFVLAAACLTLGICTRLSTLVVYLVLVSCDARNSYIFTGADTLMRIESFLLIFSQCGSALSVDRLLSIWLRRKPDYGPAEPKSPWALRLLQVQIALLYGAAFSSKLCGSTWINGSAIYYVTHFTEESKYTLPYLYSHLWTCKLLSWSTLIIEFSLAVLIWLKQLRLPLVLIGIAFHLMLDYTLIIPQLQFLMIASLLTFVEPQIFSQIMSSIRTHARNLPGAPLQAAYDGAVDLSRRLAETVRRLDVFGLVTLIDVRKASMEIPGQHDTGALGATGVFIALPSKQGWESGVSALAQLAWRLPMLAILSPLFYLPRFDRLLGAVANLLKQLYPGRDPAPEPAV